MTVQTHHHREQGKKQPPTAPQRIVKPALDNAALTPAARALVEPSLLRPAGVIALQRTAGNRAVSDLLQARPLAATDTPLVQRQAEDEELQAKPLTPGSKGGEAFTPELEQLLTARKGHGSPLPANLQTAMEARFGGDFSAVRLHTDSDATNLNRALSAQAFTHGADIYLGAGQHNPASAEGQRLLAHELTHTLQQGAVKPVARTASVRPAAQAHSVVQRVLNPLEWWQQLKNTKQGAQDARKEYKEAKTKKGKAGAVMGGIGKGIEALAGGLQGDQREEVGMAGLYAATMSGPENKEFKPTGKFSEFLDKDAPSGLMNATYTAQGAGQALSGIMGIGKGIQQQFSGSRFQQHGGAKKIERGVMDILGGGTSMGSGIEGLVGDSAKTLAKVGGENVPVLDVIYNYTLAGLKGKETLEDALTAKAMKSHAGELEQKKRGAMQNIPEFNRLHFMEDWNAKQAYRRLQQSGSRTQKLKFALSHPGLLTSKPEPYFRKKTEGKARAQIKQNYKQARQDVRVLEQKAKMGQRLNWTERQKINAFQTKYQGYEGYREAQKTAKFIGRRKAESATVKGVETAGYALDATGTFTAGADFGATKATGKFLKFGASAYKGLRTLGRRAAKVHHLRQAKNLLNYGGKSDRGVGWGMKQFFFGNVDAQRGKVQKGIDEPDKIGEQFYAPGKKINEEYGGRGWDRGYNRWVAERKMLGSPLALDGQTSRWARVGVLAAEKNQAEYGGKKDRGLGWKLRQYLSPGSVTAKSTGFRRALARGTTGKAMTMTPETAVRARRLVTTSGERRQEQFFKGLQSSNPDIQKENLRLYNRLAGGSLGGKLSQLRRGKATAEDIAKWGTDEKLAEKDKEAIKDLFEKETSL